MDKTEFAAYYTDEKVATLQAAFNMVADQTNWKLPIDALLMLPKGAEKLLREAIIFYTGSVPEFVRSSDNMNTVRVRAAGYYRTIGA